MPNTFELISSTTVGSGGTSSITFSSIPQTYTDLKILMSLRTDRPSEFTDYVSVRPNNSTSNLSSRYIYFSNTSLGSITDSSIYGAVNSTTSTANVFGSSELYISNYSSTSRNKSIALDSFTENNSTSNYAHTVAGLWSDTSAITSLTLVSLNGANWIQNSTAYLYGIKNS